MRLLLVFLLGLSAWAQVPFEALFRATAGPRWIDRAAQVKAESLFRPGVTAPDGGMGLAQFMPATWDWAVAQGWVSQDSSPYRAPDAIRAQHAYMLWLEARTGGQLDPALGAYNAGLSRVRKAQMLADQMGIEGHGAWLRTLPRVTGPKNAEITRRYLQRNRTYRLEMGGAP